VVSSTGRKLVDEEEVFWLNMTAEVRCHLGGEETAVLRFSEGKDAFMLDLVLVPAKFRGRGLGTALVRRLLRLADAVGKPVHTTARPIGRSTPDTLSRLVLYYERLGFHVLQRGVASVLMRRPVPGQDE
jgi:GNAT superfamily N-acetyltransferase